MTTSSTAGESGGTGRRRWEVWVTDAERARVTAAARAARLPIGPCLARLARSTPIVRRDDWRRGVARLGQAVALLEELADHVRDAPDPLDALTLATHLVALERSLDGLARPWMMTEDDAGTALRDTDDDGCAPC